MGIFSRFSDIVNANINAVLEKAEDPEKIIRLMIQEMEDTLVEIRSAAARCIADSKENRRHVEYLEREIGEWENRAELALRRDREDLARAALAEKQAIDDQVRQLREEAGHLDAQLEKFNTDITQLQSKLNDAKARQRSIVIRHKTATSQLAARKHIHSDRIDEMLFRFENAERRIDRVESEAEAESMGHNRTLADEIAGLEDEDRVREELEKLKTRMRGGNDAANAGASEKAATREADSGKEND
ncbi:phage shock protein PspA [Elongatibacter sediminis]|uniref:Phage shock protein PspA n=1 Tax=Elongatibacter sediminis TaxID=3119006 RepID=A0AAW9RAU6_9GAMM